MIRIGVGGALAVEVILTGIFAFVVLRVTSATANAATAAMMGFISIAQNLPAVQHLGRTKERVHQASPHYQG